MKPKIIGITTYVESWHVQLALAKKLKQLLPSAMIVAGGHCATFCYRDMLRGGVFDCAIAGEGEEAFVQLCDYYIKGQGELKQVNNLIYRENDDIIVNERKRIVDIEALPFPDRNVLELDKYSYAFTLSTSRGCPGRCIFCSSHAFWGNKVIIRSPKNIIDEIDAVYQQFKLTDFFVIDDTFTLIPKRTIEFCDLLNELGEKYNVSFKWGCESRADVVTEEVLAKMKQAGCVMVQFGMESGNDEILKSIKKNITYSQLYTAVTLAHKVGLKMNVSIILGHHLDTKETIEETISKGKDMKEKFGANVLFSINTPYPGTELRESIDKFDLELLFTEVSKLRINIPSFRSKLISEREVNQYFVEAQYISSYLIPN
ncbi:radical SAM superfamily enzyme YgiQ (UPF0313 family) [Lachnotalea glycerini]|uniref:Radical SAM protein n=1 Tax=Lachnotalea glycerini TaxID=1763509 RepID=A0A255IBL9_9FIRM|nr:radical SAM protein [Lachnotalea glycerini]OYO75962.1 hypothetical protein CG709_16540 [Lachnotalea glycerini]PXV91648.1 radical SAM superfamily enzyme YgiQ (UPF0313 family) [Lachnotalea glycerini]RDY30798.1 radical SAM protein [Lachnotalea glycerini]